MNYQIGILINNKSKILKKPTENYKSILANTTLFGSIGALKIAINIIQTKIIAIILGPSGIGLIDLINSISNTIGTFVNLGIGTTGVKEISISENNSKIEIAYTIKVIRIIVICSSIIGLILFMTLFPILSNFKIFNNNYIMIIIIGFSLMFNQIAAGYFTILQGLQKFKFLAKISIISTIINLAVSYFIYLILEVNGIAIVFLLNSVFSVIISYIFYKKLKINNLKLKKKYLFCKTKKLLSFGFILTLTGLIPLLFSYFFKIIIAKEGIQILGLYTAGYAIVNMYSNVVFTSMSSDYLPRLSNVINIKEKYIEVVNKQSEIAIIIFSPIILFFIVYSKALIKILYSSKFETIDSLLILISLGTFFKMLSYPIATILIAKGEKRTFFINELFYNIYNFIIGVIFFKKYGLIGLGLSFILSYLFYFIQVYLLTNRLYNFSFNRIAIKLCLSNLALILIPIFIFFNYYTDNVLTRIIIGSFFTIISIIYSFWQLKIRVKPV